jgi:hypothetical protein
MSVTKLQEYSLTQQERISRKSDERLIALAVNIIENCSVKKLTLKIC